jgi:hypothetical protein
VAKWRMNWLEVGLAQSDTEAPTPHAVFPPLRSEVAYDTGS